ncbi:hypothetical protein HDV03_000722 [Kappamyces sp. JEL0829]|nr:hypothetical protein HDV03_000722 [Kappamyces sp. JEL0829]
MPQYPHHYYLQASDHHAKINSNSRAVAVSSSEQESETVLHSRYQPNQSASEPAQTPPKNRPTRAKKAVYPPESRSPQMESHDRSDAYDPEGDSLEDRRKQFLERNRIAASKCRLKKKQWIQELQEKNDQITAHNKELQEVVFALHRQIDSLNARLEGHARNCSCQRL